MTENPYRPVTQATGDEIPNRCSAWKAYGFLNAALVVLPLASVVFAVAELWLAGAFESPDYSGDPVVYQHYVTIEPPALLFLAIYFFIPNAILRFIRRS